VEYFLLLARSPIRRSRVGSLLLNNLKFFTSKLRRTAKTTTTTTKKKKNKNKKINKMMIVVATTTTKPSSFCSRLLSLKRGGGGGNTTASNNNNRANGSSANNILRRMRSHFFATTSSSSASSSSTSKKKNDKKEDDDGVHVYVLQRNECEAPALLQRYERLLSKKELESIQIDSLHEETRKERLQTRAMVRTVLSSYLVEKGMKSDPARLEFTFNEKGKPFLSNKVGSGNESNLIQFSVSHSKNIIAMAVTTDGRRVGIDCEVEKRRTKDTCLKLAKRYFKKGEAVERIESALADDEDEGRKLFVRYWCLCESYVKALGVGISGRPFRNFDIALGKQKQDKKDAPHDDITLVESDPETFGRWRFQLFRETLAIDALASPPLKSESEESKDERSIVAVCVEDDDDEDDNKNRDENIPKRPPIVSSIKRVRPLLDDVNASNAAANADDDDDYEIFEIVAASF